MQWVILLCFALDPKLIKEDWIHLKCRNTHLMFNKVLGKFESLFNINEGALVHICNSKKRNKDSMIRFSIDALPSP
jgi:hypothetical protein